MSVFTVELKRVVDDTYSIEIGFGLFNKLAEDLKGGLAGGLKKCAIITDSNVLPLYARPLSELLEREGYSVQVFPFEAGEKSKTREVKAQIEDSMLAAGYRRDCFVLAVGGGVVTDLAGFLAGTYGRGVPFINYATTLLSAADASIGGKTAVDTPLATNLIGMFNQPEKVYIDAAAWRTLDPRELHSGMAETIKHACIADRDFFEWLEDNMDRVYSLDESACAHVCERNCRIKYQVVMKDERETGLREILNLGHTVGRAVETCSGYRLLHGEAVSIGLSAQLELSERLGHVTHEEAERVRSLLRKASLPVKIPDYIDREGLVRKLYTDKKTRNGTLRFVVQDGIGKVVEFAPNVYATPVEESVAREIIMSV